MTKLERKECLQLWRAGATLKALANHFNRHRSTISKLIARRGAQKGFRGRYSNRTLTNSEPST